LTSKLITCFVDSFTFKIESQSITHILNGSDHVNWILDRESEVHSIWDLWISGLQNARAMVFYEVGRAGKSFRSGLENLWGLPLPESTSPEKVVK
jgi:hypothetical protein